MVTLITNLGAIGIKLDNEHTPETTANFLKYAQANFYNNTIFHRVIENFVVQGGGFEPGMHQKRTQTPIKNEAKNAMKNFRGTIAMARTADPHSATSQFFVNLKDNHFLDYSSETPQGWGYCVFGKIVSGMDIIDQIAKVQTKTRNGHENVPIEDIMIEKVVIDG